MGYDLHITRKKNWDGFEDERGAEVSFDEWTTLVNVDRDMRLDGFCEVPLADGRKFRHADPSIAVWTAWSHHGEAGDMAWFSLRHGNVVVKNPDREIRRKMWWLARSLKAKVQGEGCEFYDRFGNPPAIPQGRRITCSHCSGISASGLSTEIRLAATTRLVRSRGFLWLISSRPLRRIRASHLSPAAC